MSGTYKGKIDVMDTERFRDMAYLYLTGYWSQRKCAKIAQLSVPTFKKYLAQYIASGRAKVEFEYYYGYGKKGDSSGTGQQD